jgi:hypothetical protein
MTPDEARQVLTAARDTARYQRWQEVYDLVFPVHEEGVLDGEEQAELAFLIGDACQGLESWDAAAHYWEMAAISGSSEVAGKARERLQQVQHHDAAIDAEDGGVTQDESAAVLAAADEDYGRHAYAEALARYEHVYQGAVAGEAKYRAALGIGSCKAATHELVEARQYAEYVAQNGGNLASHGQSLVAHIDQLVAADAATADGSTPDEFAKTREGGRAAFFNGSYQEAYDLFSSLVDSDSIAGSDRADMAYNAGMCKRFLGDDAGARQLFEYAVAHGVGGVVAKAQDHITKIDQQVAATELVAELAGD